MTRTPPPSDWVVYLVVLGTVAAIMFGKYLIGRGSSEKIEEDKKDIVDDKS